ncbi:MAG: hypothetical protein R6U17_09860 [Thermoplasmata archaeon]
MSEEEIETLVDKYTRKELNRLAAEEKIENPEGLANKTAVAEEIVKARKAKKYIKKPAGLYITKD